MTGRAAAVTGGRGLPDPGRRLTRFAARLLLAVSLAWLAPALTACGSSITPTPVSKPAATLTPSPVATASRPSVPTPSPMPLPVIRVGIDAANRPWSFRDAAGQLAGLDVDLVTALAAGMGVRVEYVDAAPHLLLPGLAGRKFDLVAAGLVATTERQAQVSLSEPYFHLGQVVVARTSDALSSTASLAGVVTGVQIGSPSVEEARRLGATPRLYDDLSIALGALARGEVPAVVGDDLLVADYLAANPDARLRRVGASFAQAPVVLAVSKDQPALLARVNAALAALKQSGALDQLSGKWLR